MNKNVLTKGMLERAFQSYVTIEKLTKVLVTGGHAGVLLGGLKYGSVADKFKSGMVEVVEALVKEFTHADEDGYLG